MRGVDIHPHAFSPAEVEAFAQACLRSPFLAQSALKGTFNATYGFSLTFRRDGADAVGRRFSYLGPYVQRLVVGSQHVAVRTRWHRWRGSAYRRPNAFLLNPLLIRSGGLKKHVDTTLSGKVGVAAATPEVVSVLYVQAPADGEGGLLQLWRKEALLGEILPHAGMVVHFCGNLVHSVTPFVSRSGQARMSFVCEQYHFAQEVLARLPRMHVRSMRGFAAVLAETQQRVGRALTGVTPVEGLDASRGAAKGTQQVLVQGVGTEGLGTLQGGGGFIV